MARNMLTQSSPKMPSGTEVAAFRTHEEATAAVEVLAKDGFPLTAVTVVGSDLHLAERIIGKMTPTKVAISGATQGLMWGLMMGIFSMLFYTEATFLVPLILVCAGVLLGMVISVVGWSLSKNRGSFAVQSTMVATRYAVLVAQMPDRAFKLLAHVPGNIAGQPRRPVRRGEAGESGAPHSSGQGRPSAPAVRPTEYGSRSDEAPRFGVRLADRSKEPQTSAESAGSEQGEPAEVTGD